MSLTLHPLGLTMRSNEGTRTYTYKGRVDSTASPAVNTVFDVYAFMAANGFYDGALLVGDLAATCTGVDVDIARDNIKGGVWKWPVSATFATKTGKDPQSSNKDDPKDRPWKISVRQDNYTGVALKNTAGDPVLNTAGDTVRREKQRSRAVITIDGSCASFLPGWCQEQPDGFVWSRNAAAWSPFGSYAALFQTATVGAGMGLLRAFTADVGFEKAETHIDFHAEVLLDEGLHVDKFWSEGFREKVGGVLRQCQDPKTGQYVSAPAFLRGDGTQAAAGDAPYELSHNYYPTADWSGLPFWAGSP